MPLGCRFSSSQGSTVHIRRMLTGESGAWVCVCTTQNHTPRNASVQMRTLAQAAAAASPGGGGGGGSTTPPRAMRTMHAAMRPPAVDITGDETDSELSPQTANGEFGNPESPGPPPAAAAAAARHQRQPSGDDGVGVGAGVGVGVGAGASSRQLPAASSTSKRPGLSPSQRSGVGRRDPTSPGGWMGSSAAGRVAAAATTSTTGAGRESSGREAAASAAAAAAAAAAARAEAEQRAVARQLAREVAPAAVRAWVQRGWALPQPDGHKAKVLEDYLAEQVRVLPV